MADASKPNAASAKGKEKGKDQASAVAAKKGKDRSDLLGIEAKKLENFADWYREVIMRSELLDYYDISGCYIFRPWSFGIWEEIQNFFGGEIKKLGVKNGCFPLLVSKSALEKEASHIEGFSAEVAWVTKSGKSDLAEPVAIRPTSETIIYPAYAQWIRSHRDMPLKMNQWCNVLRWEFKHPVPFLRSREFLWQEGHSAFATKEEAEEEVLQILELYRRTYEEVLAVPVVTGRKTENEKFAGGWYTTTCEAFVDANGRGVQGATSHGLGQNFSKMFGIQFESIKAGEKEFAWQNSWGISTRSIGVMVMVHGDDKGLVLPPRAAPVQVVIIPIHFKGKDNDAVTAKCKELHGMLGSWGFRSELDDRENYNPGFKYNFWEVKGVPVRIEIGPRDLENNQVMAVRRVDGKKETVKFDLLKQRLTEIMTEIHTIMFDRAKNVRMQSTAEITKWEDFVPTLNQKKIVLAPWCEVAACEDDIKLTSGTEAKADELEGHKLTGAAKSLCIPFQQKKLEDGAVCFRCKKPAKVWCLFGRSY